MALTIAEELTKTLNTKESIRAAITNKGVSVPTNIPFDQYASKIDSIPQESTGGGTQPSGDGEWVRPSDRPPLPFNDVENGTDLPDNTIYMLFGVEPNGVNAVYMAFKPCLYTIDWGDGNEIQQTLTGTGVTYTYDYDSLNVTPNKVGIKWVWIKIFDISGSLNGVFSSDATPTPYVTSAGVTVSWVLNVYEMYVNTSRFTEFTFTTGNKALWYKLDTFKSYTTGKILSFKNFLRDCINLKNLKLPDTSNATNFDSFLFGCSQLNTPIVVDTSNATNIQSFMVNTHSFAQTIELDTSKVLSPYFSTVVLNGNHLLTGLRIRNFNSGISALTLSGKPFSAAALTSIFVDLYDRTSEVSGTLTIKGCYGALHLTPGQRAIATSKNWTIVE